MCLSTVYNSEMTKDKILMSNVVSIEIEDNFIILTDLMERQLKIKGKLIKANLVDGYVIVQEDN